MIGSFSFSPKPSLDRLGDTSQQGTGLWPEELVYAGDPVSGGRRQGPRVIWRMGKGLGQELGCIKQTN